MLWVLGMTQAINLIDGLDGLAAGIVAIAAGAFFLYSQRARPTLDLLTPPNLGPLIAIIAVGMCVGFLPHNFNPARIFMGDSGALLLGLLLAVSTSVVGGRADPTRSSPARRSSSSPRSSSRCSSSACRSSTLLFAIVRRADRRQGWRRADKGHLHHRLMNLGHGHRRSVLILWAWTALLSAFVLYPVLTGEQSRRTCRSAWPPCWHRAVHRACTRSVRRRPGDNGESVGSGARACVTLVPAV